MRIRYGTGAERQREHRRPPRSVRRYGCCGATGAPDGDSGPGRPGPEALGTGTVGPLVPPGLGAGGVAASVGRAVGLSDAVAGGRPAGGADGGRADPPAPAAAGGAAASEWSGARSGAGRNPSECSDEERSPGSGPPDAAGAGTPGTGAEDRAPLGLTGSGAPDAVAVPPLLSATPGRGTAVVAGAGGTDRAGPDAPEGLPVVGAGAPAGPAAGGEAPGLGVPPVAPSYWTAAAVPPARAATETTSVHHTAVRGRCPARPCPSPPGLPEGSSGTDPRCGPGPRGGGRRWWVRCPPAPDRATPSRPIARPPRRRRGRRRGRQPGRIRPAGASRRGERRHSRTMRGLSLLSSARVGFSGRPAAGPRAGPWSTRRAAPVRPAGLPKRYARAPPAVPRPPPPAQPGRGAGWGRVPHVTRWSRHRRALDVTSETEVSYPHYVRVCWFLKHCVRFAVHRQA
ncbi:hypothetical protein KPATCC21470_0299 [Kitasatospora purpeofusca]